MSNEKETWPHAPDSKTCEAAWDTIMRIAGEHALIVQAYGGVATLALPDEQRNAGVRQRTLNAVKMQEAE